MAPLIQPFVLLCSIPMILSWDNDDYTIPSWLSVLEEEIDVDMTMTGCIDEESEIKTCQDLSSEWKDFNTVTYDGSTYTKDTITDYLWRSTDPNSEGVLEFGCVNTLNGLQDESQIWISFLKKRIIINAEWAYLHSPDTWHPFNFATFMKEYGVIEGRDTDGVGTFSIDGQVEWKKNTISWHKWYDGGWGWDYQGTVDINARMLSGTYSSPGSNTASGHFRMLFPENGAQNAELWDYLIQSRDKKERALTKTIKGIIPNQTNRLFFYANYLQFASSADLSDVILLVDCPGEQREVITPHQIPDGVTLNLEGANNKLRRVNGVSRWLIKGENIGGWPLEIQMSGSEYGFESGDHESKISISMRANCKINECDGFYALGFGDTQYIVFATDFDDNGLLTSKGQVGLQIYPGCGGQVADGNAGQLLSNLGSTADYRDLRDALSGGDRSNFELLTRNGATNGEEFPITIELINNDNAGTVTFRFASPSFKRGLECTYNSAINTNQQLNMYFTPDWWTNKGDNTEVIAIRSFVLYGKRFRSSLLDYDEVMMFKGEFEEVETTNDGRMIYVVALMAVVIFGVFVLFKSKYCANSKKDMRTSSEIDPLLSV